MDELELVDIFELSQKLKISRWTLEVWKKERKIPFVRVGRRVLFSWLDIEQWVKDNSFYPEADKQDPQIIRKRVVTK